MHWQTWMMHSKLSVLFPRLANTGMNLLKWPCIGREPFTCFARRFFHRTYLLMYLYHHLCFRYIVLPQFWVGKQPRVVGRVQNWRLTQRWGSSLPPSTWHVKFTYKNIRMNMRVNMQHWQIECFTFVFSLFEVSLFKRTREIQRHCIYSLFLSFFFTSAYKHNKINKVKASHFQSLFFSLGFGCGIQILETSLLR